MWSEDIEGSEAYAKALQKTGIITEKETKEICEGLEKVRAEWATGEFKVVVSLSYLPLRIFYNVLPSFFCVFRVSNGLLLRTRS